MVSPFSSEFTAGASQVDGITTSGEPGRAGGQNVSQISQPFKGGKRNKSRKNRKSRKGGKKNVGGKRKSAKKSRSRK